MDASKMMSLVEKMTDAEVADALALAKTNGTDVYVVMALAAEAEFRKLPA